MTACDTFHCKDWFKFLKKNCIGPLNGVVNVITFKLIVISCTQQSHICWHQPSIFCQSTHTHTPSQRDSLSGFYDVMCKKMLYSPRHWLFLIEKFWTTKWSAHQAYMLTCLFSCFHTISKSRGSNATHKFPQTRFKSCSQCSHHISGWRKNRTRVTSNKQQLCWLKRAEGGWS